MSSKTWEVATQRQTHKRTMTGRGVEVADIHIHKPMRRALYLTGAGGTTVDGSMGADCQPPELGLVVFVSTALRNTFSLYTRVIK